MRDKGRWLIPLVVLLTAVGRPCGCTTRGTAAVPTSEDPPSPKLSGMTVLTRPVLLLGDNQIQFLGVGPIFERSRAVDHVAASAIRPPQLDMFGQQLLLDACQSVPKAPILHVGDATNTSCRQELERMFGIVDECESQMFVMAPGNHDGFLMGSLDPACHTDNPWTRACGPGRELTKPCFVQEYLSHVWGVPRPGPLGDVCLPAGAPVPTPWQETSSFSGSGGYRRVAWHVDLKQRYRSYILQQVDLPAPSGTTSVSAVVLDTANPDVPPSVLPAERDLGKTGSIGAAQQQIAEDWIMETLGQGGFRIVLVGHHPIEALSRDSAEFVLRLARHPQVLLYVSGHTHAGRRNYYSVEGRQSPLLDLNVGSILDYPNEYRLLQLLADAHRAAAAAPTNPGRRRPQCRPEWLPSLSEVGRYREGSLYSSSTASLAWHCLQARAWQLFFEQVPCRNRDTASLVRRLHAATNPRCEEASRQAILAASREAAELVWGSSDPGAAPRLPLTEDQLEYVRCVAYRAAEHEVNVERRLDRLNACATPLDPWRTTDPFSRGGPSEFLLSTW